MGVKWVSDFLENSVTNVTLLSVTTGGWVSCFQKQLLNKRGAVSPVVLVGCTLSTPAARVRFPG